MGGLVGGTASATVIVEYCTNEGNVYTRLSCRTGGFVGHNAGQIIGCVNKGTILGDVYTEGNGTNKHGPGWACGYSAASTATYTNVTGCVRGGSVGSWTTYKDDPTSAPEATNENAFCHNPGAFNTYINQ